MNTRCVKEKKTFNNIKDEYLDRDNNGRLLVQEIFSNCSLRRSN